MMNVTQLQPEHHSKFIEFNKTIYPDRDDIEVRFDFQILSNPLLENKEAPLIFLAWDEDRIVGQLILNPCEFLYNGEKHRCYIGSDFYVLEQYRKSGAGALLALRSINVYKPYFAMGLSEAAKEIHLALRNYVIGSIHSYLWLRNYLSPLRAGAFYLSKGKWKPTLKSIDRACLPQYLDAGNARFRLADQPFERDANALNAGILEFARDTNYIKWRFFYHNDRYYVYLKENGGGTTYFVARYINRRGLHLLAAVDYRFGSAVEEELPGVLTAMKQLAGVLRLDGVMVGSSLGIFDSILSRSSFRKVARPGLIMTNARVKLDAQRINNRNSILVTLADSDTELNYY